MEGVEEKLRAGGWGRCLEMTADAVGRATAVSQAAACHWSPSRFVAQEVVDEREAQAPADLPDEINFG